MISQSAIGNIIFSNYENLISYAKSNYQFILATGGSFEELVNESVVNVFDCPKEFDNEKEVIDFVKNAIKLAAFRHNEIYKSKNFYIKKSGLADLEVAPEYSLLDNPIKEYDFKNVFELFENARFGVDNEKRVCLKCGARKFTKARNQVEECMTCGYQMSIRRGTYLHKSKTSYYKLFLFCRLFCNDTSLTASYLSRYCEITYKTSWKFHQLLRCIFEQTKNTDLNFVIEKLLTPTSTDRLPIKLTNKPLKFTFEDVSDIRMQAKAGIRLSELAKAYDSDQSTINKIVKHKIYRNIPQLSTFINSVMV